MNRPFACDVYRDNQPASGAWNMAFDEALLEQALTEERCHFRLYRWSAPTISLGYFQEYQRDTIPESMRLLAVVRRLSGGGAILHHHELTYSCSVPRTHDFSERPTELYSAIHQILIDAFSEQNFSSALRGSAVAFSSGEPFLCFSRGDERDIVHYSHKIVGSAQRRRKGAVLQHGSILLRRSDLAPQFPGIEDLLTQGPLFDEDRLEETLCTRIPSLLGQPERAFLPPQKIEQRARDLCETKYQSYEKGFVSRHTSDRETEP